MALLGQEVSEYRQVRRRLFQAGEFEPGVKRRSRRGLGGQCFSIAAGKYLPDFGARPLVVDNDEPPRLAEPNGWCKTCKFNEVFERAGGQLVAAEMPHVPPPRQQLTQPRRESFVKSERLIVSDQGFVSNAS